MDKRSNIDLAFYRIERAKENFDDANLLYENQRYKSANNRAYYSIFYAIRAVLAIEGKGFKRHKDVIAYFNQFYVKNEIFSRELGRKIAKSMKIREDSDYDDEFIVTANDTNHQIKTDDILIKEVELYLNKRK